MRSFTGALHVFLSGAVLSYRALFRWFRPSTYLASKVIMPLAQMTFFVFIGSFGGQHPAGFFVIGNAMQIAAVSGIYGVTMSIAGDRWDGTLAYLFGSPAGRLPMFFGRAAVHILDGIVGVAIAFAWGMILFGLKLTLAQAGVLLAVVLVTVFSTSGLGLLMGCVGLITRNVMFVNNTVYFLLLFLSGANIAVSSLPGWLQTVSACLPMQHGIAAARLVASAGTGTGGAVLTLLAQEALVGVVYLTVGYLLFSSFERRAKARGTLETM